MIPPIYFSNSSLARSFYYRTVITGALLGFLIALSSGLIMYSTSNLANLTATLVDPIANGVLTGIAGGVVAVVLGSKIGD